MAWRSKATTHIFPSRSNAIPSAPARYGCATKTLSRQRVLGAKVVSQPVLLLKWPSRLNVACQIAPRAVSAMNSLSPSLSKAIPLATKATEPKVLAALRDVGVTVIVPCGSTRTSRPTPPTPLDEIDLIRHRLDTKNLFAVNRRRGSTVGSRSSYFPNSSLSRHSVTHPEVSFLIESDAVGSRNARGENGGVGRIVGAWVKRVNGPGGCVSYKQIADLVKRNSLEFAGPGRGYNQSDRNQTGLLEIDLPNRAGRRARTTGIQITVIIAGQPLDEAWRCDQSCNGRIPRKRTLSSSSPQADEPPKFGKDVEAEGKEDSCK